MSVLDGFKSFNFNEGVPYVSITINGITFNKSVILKMDYPEYVVLLIDEVGKRIALQKCTEDIPNAVPFYKEKNSKVLSVRWNARDLINTIQEFMNWNLSVNGYRVNGTLLREEHAILFDLNNAIELK